MDTARDRLEVVDGERPRIEETVPPHDVERVVVEHVRLVAAAHTHLHGEVAFLAVGVQLRRRMDVAVVVRRALEHLSVVVAVALRDLDQPRRLEYEVALVDFGPETVGRPARDDDVVAVLVRDVAEDRLERARALVDEDDFVALAVAEEVVHLLLRAAEGDLDVVVPHQHAAAGELVAFRVDAVGLEVAMRMRVRNPLVTLDLLEVADSHHAAGRLEVVQDRLQPDETLHPHDLFGQERSVVSELDVTLAGDVAQTLVERHGYRISAVIWANRRPIAGANLKPWPLQGEPITTRPRRSRMKCSSGVVVYMQVSAPTGSGSASGYVRATHSAIRSTSAGSGSPSSSGPTLAPAWCAPAFRP